MKISRLLAVLCSAVMALTAFASCADDDESALNIETSATTVTAAATETTTTAATTAAATETTTTTTETTTAEPETTTTEPETTTTTTTAATSAATTTTAKKATTTTTKPTVTTTTTTTTKKTTTTTTTKVDPLAFVRAGGTCEFCGKKFSGNGGYNLKSYYNDVGGKTEICNTCLNSKCFYCGKSCNSSNGVKTQYPYTHTESDWSVTYLCSIWTCYDCNPEADPQYYTKLARKSEQEMLTLTQQLRKNNGRTQFYVDPQLTAWAQIRAKELATKFAHGRPSGGAGINIITTYSDRGENIVMAEGTTNGTTLYKSLEGSSGHKGTMLNTDYTAVGIGVYYDPKTGYSYACQLFGGSPYNK